MRTFATPSKQQCQSMPWGMEASSLIYKDSKKARSDASLTFWSKVSEFDLTWSKIFGGFAKICELCSKNDYGKE